MITPQPTVDIIVTITRYWALESLFKCLENLICDPLKTNLILYVDSDDPRIINHIEDYTDVCKYKLVKIEFSGKPAPSEIRIKTRRDRIVANHNEIKKLIESDYILEVEDDTIFPENTLQKLLPPIMRADIGFVEGVQAGRWGYKMIGAWRVDNLADPQTILTMPYLKAGDKNTYLENIDAGGFYCYMTKSILFKGAKFGWHDECFGPDVSFGLDLRRQGFKVLIDWSLICGHNVKTTIIYPDEKVCQVRYNKINNEWRLDGHKA